MFHVIAAVSRLNLERTSSGNVDLSVIVCTLNRSDVLKGCLEALVRQELGPFTVEIIVVDNGSTDDTRLVAESFKQSFPGLRYVFEPQGGLARARQSGFGASLGRYIAYIDDDAVAAVRWCSVICETLARVEQSTANTIVALGGPVVPVFETARPPWLTEELASLYAIVDMGKSSRPIPAPACPVGANMAFTRSVLTANPWDSRLLMCEEVTLFSQLRRKGFNFLYVPEMRVQHFISVKRLQQKWLLERHFAEGIAQFYLPLPSHQKLWLLIASVLKLPPLLLLSRWGSEQLQLRYRCGAKFYSGYLAALMGLRNVRSTMYMAARSKA